MIGGATQCQKTFVKPAEESEAGVVGNAEAQVQFEVTTVTTATERDGSDAHPAAASDTTKSAVLELAQTYVTAYAAWWRSLMAPPFNGKKSAEHEALAVAQHEAFLAYDGGIDEARKIIG